MEYYYSYQIDHNGNLFCVGRHWPNPPSENDIEQGCKVIISKNYYPSIEAGMRLDMQAGGFYKVDQYGNNIINSFVPFEG